MKSNVPAYLESWSSELMSRADRVRQLIGEAHWLSDGHHKEELLRDFLRRHLSSDLVATRGFVTADNESRRCSPEVDILVSDPRLNPPLFNEGGLQIVDPSSVIASIEVKTQFGKAALMDAFSATTRTRSVISSRRDLKQVWTGVVLYSGSRAPASILRTLEAAVIETAKVANAEGWLRLGCWPTVLVVLSRAVVFLSQDDPAEIQCRLFELKELSMACAMADLFGHIRRVRGGPPWGGLDDVIESLNVGHPIKQSIRLRGI